MECDFLVMDFDELKIKLNDILKNIQKLKDALRISEKREKLEEIEKISSNPDFWNNSETSTKLLQETKVLKKGIDRYADLELKHSDALTYLELAEEANDIESYKEAGKLIDVLTELIEKLEIETLLSDEYDEHNAIITIHPGAGGTESQDWALMLYRMYTKWALKSEYELEVLDMQDGDEAGLKSVSFMIKGENAYGYLKGEKGVHRLVRISPFDANSRRHTSFAAVEVMPEILDDVSIDIKPEDLEVDTYRSSGAGGQHVNKTESAIRIKHVPTGIVVTCQTERSQIQNREYAMKMLRAKIFELEKQKQEEKLLGIKGETSDNAWGSQIRSYVFCPYTLVKDHRTNCEIGNIQAVMDGKLDEFMFEYLKYINSKNNKN
jgi:peptide chain release factor 2